MKYITTVDETEYIIELSQDGITVNGQSYQIDFQHLDHSGIMSLLIDNHSFDAVVEQHDNMLWDVLILGDVYTVKVQDERAFRMAQAGQTSGHATGEVTIKSPMPGVILKIPVAVGDAVVKKQTIAILESMKMENELKSTRDGTVLRILVEPGVTVEKDQPLVVIGDAD